MLSTPQTHSSPKAASLIPKKTTPDVRGNELGRLKRLGFDVLAECLLSVPRNYYDFTRPTSKVNDVELDRGAYFILRVQEVSAYDRNNRPTTYWPNVFRVEAICTDAIGVQVKATTFGNVWPWKVIQPGQVVHLYGRLSDFRGNLQLQMPKLIELGMRGKVGCDYRGKPGQVSGEALAEGVSRAMHRLDEASVLLLAQAGLREAEFPALCGFPSAESLLTQLHNPKTLAEGLRARAAARKLTAETVVRRAAGAKSRPSVATSAIAIDKNFLKEITGELKYELTHDQARTVAEIVDDLRSAFPMRRLLSGDVGTGKSIAFMLPAAAAYQAGAEVAILAPSELVAEQLARELVQHFPGLPVCLVLGGNSLGEGICVGTTALFRAAKKAKRTFSLLIIDEQHKFGVDQKLALVSKSTNVLEATATAIPRTLALVNFGGMDVSLLMESPVVKNVETVVVDDEAMADVHNFIARDILATGGQIAVVYPLVADAVLKPELEATVRAGAKPRPGPSTAGLESVLIFE